MKTSTKATEATEVIEKDTEAKLGNKKEAPKGAATLEDSPTMTEEDIMTAKKIQKDACAKEVNAVLAKYGCDFSARVLVTEQGNFPQVFIVDARAGS